MQFQKHYNDKEQDSFSCDGYSLLAYSIHSGAKKVTGYILEQNRVDVCKCGSNEKTPLYVAIEKQDLPLIKTLLQYGAKPTVQSAFLKAIEIQNFEILSFLVNNGAYVNFNYKNKISSLSAAVKTGSVKVATFLVQNGARWDFMETEIQKLCLSDLIASTHYNMLSFLAGNLKIDLNVPILNNYTCLTLSVQKKNFRMTAILLEHNVQINAFDEGKRLPLKIAVETDQLNIAVNLINHGANPKLAQEAVTKYAAKNDDFKACLQSIVNNYI